MHLPQYLSLPHIFLLVSQNPVGFLPDSYWISTKFPKRHFHIFFHSLPTGDSYWTPTRLLLDSYWTPTGLLLDSHWTPTELKQCESNASNIGFLLDSYWTSTGVSCNLLLLRFHILDITYLITLYQHFIKSDLKIPYKICRDMVLIIIDNKYFTNLIW